MEHKMQLTTWLVFRLVERRFHGRESNRQPLHSVWVPFHYHLSLGSSWIISQRHYEFNTHDFNDLWYFIATKVSINCPFNYRGHPSDACQTKKKTKQMTPYIGEMSSELYVKPLKERRNRGFDPFLRKLSIKRSIAVANKTPTHLQTKDVRSLLEFWYIFSSQVVKEATCYHKETMANTIIFQV
jgi:hypothetical protein